MNNPSPRKTQLKEAANVETVVQEYMDSLLVDLFPDVTEDEVTEVKQSITEQPTLDITETATEPQTVIETQAKVDIPDVVVTEPQVVTDFETTTHDATAEPITQTVAEPQTEPSSPVEASVTTPAEVDTKLEIQAEDIEPQVEEVAAVQITAKPEELRFPQAPEWAQQSFDVLLFDVCGLKLAVPMESLGKIIKVEHETNHLIGRPSWFIGAYNENDQNLYVVDTAQYIMPEKGFNLARDGFEYVIQLQRSQWTLACKKVHSTVRLEPDQVKWRSQEGKRQWLSGTVIDHMCALIHVDTLIDLLHAEAS
ncbi:chemotaxis protein CheW [Oceaniserpentilla sp. 4NH20-0058]|uniref:chemotaxis protein CheW n=1 Tax=Oceaniserpentilla sp. 4NH20-0058 TaxID=3127660 RepID=UPI003106D86A